MMVIAYSAYEHRKDNEPPTAVNMDACSKVADLASAVYVRSATTLPQLWRCHSRGNVVLAEAWQLERLPF